MEKIFNFAPRFYKLIKMFYFVSVIKYMYFKIFKKNITFELEGKQNFKLFLRGNTTDVDVFEQIILSEEFRKISLSNVHTIIDAGANTGISSLYFSIRFPDAQIYSIEPESNNAKLLIKNTHKFKNIVFINKAIWNTDTTLFIHDRNTGHWGFNTNNTKSSIQDQTVEATSINSLLTTYDIPYIDILKIDIEGSEKELFEHNYEDWIPKCKIILVEVHDYIKQNASKILFTTISKYDFTFSITGEYAVFENRKLIDKIQ